MTLDPAPIILLIDDHDDSREIVAAWLRLEGRNVLEFERAQPALELLLQRQGAGLSTVIVTDLTLPGMTGVELATQIRADELTVHVPIIALTGRADVAFGPGELFDDLIVKPFDPNELLASVTRSLSDEARVSSLRTRPSPARHIPRSSSSGG